MTTREYFAARRFELTLATHPERGAPAPDTQLSGASRAWRLDVTLQSAAERGAFFAAARRGPVDCVVGDLSEVLAGAADAMYANAVLLRIDIPADKVEIVSSVTGLPPMFVHRDGAATTVSSPFLPEAARGALAADPEGVADLLRWGHPIDGRTLYAAVSVVGSAVTLAAGPGGILEQRTAPTWAVAELPSSASLPDIVRAQIAEFLSSARRMAQPGSFVSLSGGLDSRAALAGVLEGGTPVPCVTLAGSPSNLDARIAGAFCKSHGLEHHLVMLDERFLGQLPDLVSRTAELTGGVSCLTQAVDLHLYDRIPAGLTRRISGNLGNQVGRGGVESLSAYGTTEQIFAPRVRDSLARRPMAPWFLDRMNGGNYGAVLFGQEVHYWSVANYVVGASRAGQVTPYATRKLMRLACALFARDAQLLRPQWKVMRRRDLHHRFEGPPLARSFQRQILAGRETRGRRVPLNWGWYASGGWSPRWMSRAALSAMDAAAIKFARKSALARLVSRGLSAGFGHPSTLVDWPDAVRSRLQGLARDVFASRAVREAGVFELPQLDRAVDQHFSAAADHHAALSRSLEIGLALLSRARPAPAAASG